MYKKVIGLTALAMLSTPLLADDRWSVNGGLNYYLFDNDRILEDDFGYGVNVEKRFDDLGLRFGVNTIETDLGAATGDDVDVWVYQLDGLFYLTEHGNWQPYLLGGLAHAELDYNDKQKEAQVSAGGGARYAFNDNWHWWVEARAVLGIDSDKNGDGVLSTGIGYSFGEKSSAAPAAVVAAAPKDSDGDGVFDDKDQCPGTPAGVAVDSVGCPLDTDGDGVADYQDRCPDTPAGTKVDDLGCSDLVGEVRLNVQFALDSAELDPAYLSDVEKVANFMKEHPQLTVTIEGHTDSQGQDAYNQGLSERRAASVADALVQRYGIERSRVQSKGFGETDPVASNDTAEGRAENRRVVAVVRTTVKQ